MKQTTTWIGVLIPLIIVIGIFGDNIFGKRVENFVTPEENSKKIAELTASLQFVNDEIKKISSNPRDSTQDRHIEAIREVVQDLSKRTKHIKEETLDPRDAEQSRRIEEIREVLRNVILQLRKDDILPSGTSCGCDSAPMVDPLSGNAEPVDGCRPPGWLRLMELRSRREHTPCCDGAKTTPLQMS